MIAPVFDVLVESADEPLRHEVAARLKAALQERGAHSAHVNTSERAQRSVVASVRVRGARGVGEWIPALDAGEDADIAARGMLAFLERWGFIRAGAAARPPRAA